MDPLSPDRPLILLSCSVAPAAQALVAAMERGGYRIVVAADEDEALEAIEAMNVDLVLVHLHTADASRLDFVKLQRMSDPSGPVLPVIVLADTMTAGVEQACADARVDLRLTSPIEPRYLLDYIADLRTDRSLG